MTLDDPPPRPRQPVEADRDAHAVEALKPYLDELRARFLAAGWTELEFHYAAVSLSVTDCTYHVHQLRDATVIHALAELPEGVGDMIAAATACVHGILPGIPPYTPEPA